MLINKIFEHRIISSNDIIISVSVLYSFISSTNTRYDEFEFKKLLIDFDATIRSIDKIEQFKTLQKIISMKLDETIVESINFVFDIDNTF